MNNNNNNDDVDDDNDDDDNAVAAITSSYSYGDTKPTLSSEGSIACSSHRHNDKSEDGGPNPYTRHTHSSPPPASPSVESRSSLKRNFNYAEPVGEQPCDFT